MLGRYVQFVLLHIFCYVRYMHVSILLFNLCYIFCFIWDPRPVIHIIVYILSINSVPTNTYHINPDIIFYILNIDSVPTNTYHINPDIIINM